MALQKQKVDLMFNGLETKTDGKVLPIGKLIQLENANITKLPTIEKRNGYEEFNTTSFDTLYSKNNELLASSDNILYNYNNANNTFISKGNFYTVTTDVNIGVSGARTQSEQDICCFNGYKVITNKTSAGLYITIFHDDAIILNTTLISTTVSEYRLVRSDNYIWVIYRSSATIKSYSLNVNKLTATNNTIIGSGVDSKSIDACAVGRNCCFIYSASGTTRIAYITPNNIIGSPGLGLPADTSITLTFNTFVSIWSGTSGTISLISVAGVDSLNKVQHEQFDHNFVQTKSVYTSSAYTNTIRRITGIYNSSTDYIFIDSYATAIENSIVEYIARAGSTTTGTVVKSVSILSTPFVYNDEIFLFLEYSSASGIQNTTFLFDFTNLKIVARNFPGTTGPISSHVNKSCIDDTLVYLSCPVKKRVVSGNTFVCESGVIAVSFLKNLNNNTTLNNFYAAGGFPIIYDGINIAECGFHIFPEVPTSTTAATGGSMSDGTYLYKVCYEWVDNNGNVQRSAPSTAHSITISGGGSSQKVTLTLRTLHMTQKSNVTIGVYRTIASGTVYYKVTDDITAPVMNDTSVSIVTFIDTLTDADILDNELLYTTGGVFENTSTPSGTLIERYKNRLLIAGGECGTRIYYSKPIVNTISVEWSDLLYYDIQSEKDITAIKELDDKLIIATEDRLYVVTGEPANSTGNEDSLTRPQLLPADLGITNVQSIAMIPQGMIFQSKNGIWLLGRDLQIKYIGSPVFDYDAEIINTIVLQNSNKVLFGTKSYTVVYDYFLDIWSTYSIKTNSLVFLGNKQYFINTSSNTIWQETDNYSDNRSQIKTTIETGWISPSGIQTYQRVYNILFLGSYVDEHSLIIEISYDYEDFITDTFRINTSVINGTTFGGDSPYGSGEVYGGANGVYQFALKPTKQKCSAFKLKIYDSNNCTGGFKITHIALEVGVVRSTSRVDNTRRLQ